MKPMPYSMAYSGMPFCEASFSDKAALKLNNILEMFDQIKEALGKDVDPNIYRRPEQNRFDVWKDFYHTIQPKIISMTDLFKELELEFNRVFGFHTTSLDFIYTINGFGNWNRGKRNSRDGYDFGLINAWTYVGQRYYIDGLITEDEGFYDSTHSLKFVMEIYPHAFVELTSREILASILHEVGHNLDPALVDIGYKDTNEIVDYIRNKTTDKHVYRYLKTHLDDIPIIGRLVQVYRAATSGTKNYENRLRDSTREQLEINNGWNYANNAEAFADNIPRMYGLGKELISGLMKMGRVMDSETNKSSFTLLENMRQNTILSVMADMADENEEHATIIHRIKSLLMEYDKELADPNIPAELRRRIKEDRDGINDMLQQILNTPNEVKRKAYNIINATIDEYNAQSNGTSTSPNEKKGANPYDVKVDTPENEGDPNDIVIP